MLQRFDQQTEAAFLQLLAEKYQLLGQLDLPSKQRSITSRNFVSAINALAEYMREHNLPIPNRTVLERFRDDMAHGRWPNGEQLSVSTINARLAAARKWLRSVADDVVDLQMKIALRDWANVKDVKRTLVQDEVESEDVVDYGRRFELEAVQQFMQSFPTHLKGRRDRAVCALALGAGLRVSEIVALTKTDLYSRNRHGQLAILIRRGKHNRKRAVVMADWNSWVYKAVESYLRGAMPQHERAPIIRRVRRFEGDFISVERSITERGLQMMFEGKKPYRIEYRGELVIPAFHDFRRTYAFLCRQFGMEMDAIREQLGHSSVVTTERYIGHDVDWSHRVPGWKVDI